MLPRDIFARALEFPKDFPNDAFDPENYFQFSAMGKGSADYALSVASRFQLGTVEAVHSYGLAVVEAKNARYTLDKGVEPDPRKKYVGFYDFFAECIESVTFKTYNVRMKWRPENGRDAHFQVELLWTGADGKEARKKDRRRAVQALYDGCFGPEILPIAHFDVELAPAIANLPSKRCTHL